jgi:hypothetical protein
MRRRSIMAVIVGAVACSALLAGAEATAASRPPHHKPAHHKTTQHKTTTHKPSPSKSAQHKPSPTKTSPTKTSQHKPSTPQPAGWSTAQQVPGLAALNAGRDATISALSCASPGNCGAGGSYTSRLGYTQAFAVTQKDGTWGQAQQVPGTVALNAGGQYGAGAAITAIACPSAGDCTAVGSYEDSLRYGRVFVVTETSGRWGQAQEIPGTKKLGLGGAYTGVSSVSCSGARNCAVGGSYEHGFGPAQTAYQAFVAGERYGTWAQAGQVPGSAALNRAAGNSAGALVTSVSCTSAGNCSAGGSYQSDALHTQAFVVTEKDGTWGQAEEVPGTAALNRGPAAGGAAVAAVSCASAGNCGAGGSYEDRAGRTELFVSSETGGAWSTARELPGLARLNRGGLATLTQMSCAAPGECSAGGSYTARRGRTQAFVAVERNGVWAPAERVPGTAALNAGGQAEVESVSCATPGYCSAGGYYAAARGREYAFVVTERDGVWGRAQEVPGTAALNVGGDAAVTSVSCAAAGQCSAGGGYRGSAGYSSAGYSSAGYSSAGYSSAGYSSAGYSSAGYTSAGIQAFVVSRT